MGEPVSEVDGGVSVVDALPGRGFNVVKAPTSENQTLSLLFTGQPGDDVFLWMALVAGYAPLPARAGVFQLGSPLLLTGLPLGTVEASGQLQLDLPIGEIGGINAGFPLHFQATYRPVAGGLVLLAPATTAILIDGPF